MVDIEHQGTHLELLLGAARQATGGRWLALAFIVGQFDDLRPRGALTANLYLPIGALGVWHKQVVLRQTLPLTALLPVHLDRTVKALAAAALELRGARERGALELSLPFRVRVPLSRAAVPLGR